MNEYPKMYALIGASRRMAEEFCRERDIRPTEIGRTVFASRSNVDALRGRRGPVELVYGLDSDPRPFVDSYRPDDAEMERQAHFIQQWHERRSGDDQ